MEKSQRILVIYYKGMRSQEVKKTVHYGSKIIAECRTIELDLRFAIPCVIVQFK
jgi:hypothetical protein